MVSGYRDKLKNRTVRGYSYYSQPIIKYNKTLLYLHCNNFLMNRFNRGHWSSEEKEPSFVEFVHYLINTDPTKYDGHWQPISVICRSVR